MIPRRCWTYSTTSIPSTATLTSRTLSPAPRPSRLCVVPPSLAIPKRYGASWRSLRAAVRSSMISANARYWAKQALANPPKGVRPVDGQVAVGQLLSESDHVEERQRGIDLLEPLAKAGRGNAQAYLAVAIRNADPVRARQLLESARGTYPGAALAPLSDMLIKGEGGPKNERR